MDIFFWLQIINDIRVLMRALNFYPFFLSDKVVVLMFLFHSIHNYVVYVEVFIIIGESCNNRILLGPLAIHW